MSHLERYERLKAAMQIEGTPTEVLEAANLAIHGSADDESDPPPVPPIPPPDPGE